MKIGIEARALLSTGGTRTYTINLIDGISKIDKINKYFIFTPIKTGLKLPNNFKEIVIPIKNSISMILWEQFGIPKLIKKYKLDILHHTKNSGSFFKNCKIVTTVHDLAPILFPESQTLTQKIYWKIQIPLSIKKSDIVIAVSNYTKKDIVNYFDVSPSRVKVIYEGFNKKLFKKYSNGDHRINKIIKKYQLPHSFILFVGNLQYKKNIHTIIESLNYLKLKYNKKVNLVIVGKKCWKTNTLYNMIKKYNLTNQIFFTGRVNDNELPIFYKLSKAFIFPSYFEGFGLPILEAQSCGCPVISSNTTSIPEIINNTELMSNPNDYKKFARLIKKMLDEKIFREEAIKRGFENIKKFSWEKCAEETIKIYEEVYNEE